MDSYVATCSLTRQEYERMPEKLKTIQYTSRTRSYCSVERYFGSTTTTTATKTSV